MDARRAAARSPSSATASSAPPPPAPRRRLQIPLHLVGKCFHCFSPLHRAKDCKEEVRCNSCFRSGHRAKGCPSRGRPTQQQARATTPAPRPAASPASGHRGLPSSPTAPAPLVRSYRDALVMPRLGDPHSRPAMGRVVAPATPEMDVQADALTTNCVLISLGGDRRPASC